MSACRYVRYLVLADPLHPCTRGPTNGCGLERKAAYKEAFITLLQCQYSWMLVRCANLAAVAAHDEHDAHSWGSESLHDDVARTSRAECRWHESNRRGHGQTPKAQGGAEDCCAAYESQGTT